MLTYRFMPKSRTHAVSIKTLIPPKPKHAKILSRKIGYRGKVYTIVADRVREPKGVVALREIIRHHGSVVVLALDDSKSPPRVLLERQYRYAADDYLWELPAGHIDPGEEPAHAAQRELLEETGLTAQHWKHALKFYVSPGILDETMDVYLATGLTRGKAKPEEDERIQTRFFTLPAALKMAHSGVIKDAKTLTSLFWLDSAV
ncbi:MAG TPA: NUDIX hydrolase [Terriglobales bacterium]|nr:NUDIX hydrolase [Terriglobales bacterium]